MHSISAGFPDRHDLVIVFGLEIHGFLNDRSVDIFQSLKGSRITLLNLVFTRLFQTCLTFFVGVVPGNFSWTPETNTTRRTLRSGLELVLSFVCANIWMAMIQNTFICHLPCPKIGYIPRESASPANS